MKRYLALILAILMLAVGTLGCRFPQFICNMLKKTPAPSADVQVTPQPGQTQPSATEQAVLQPGTTSEAEPGAADAAFLALDNELFVWYVTSDITTLDQYCRNPENFGIDESTVEVTLGEFTKEANDVWIEDCVSWRDRLTAIDRDALSDHLQFAYDNYLRFLDGEIESQEWFYNYEPLDLYVGLQSNLPLVFGLYQFYDTQDVENYMTLLADVPRYMGQVLAFERERADRGWFMTEGALDTVLLDLESVAKSGETSFLHGTFEDAMEKADFLSDEQKSAYIRQNDTLVNTVWVEGYQLLYDGLKELRPQCREAIGAYAQGGEAYSYFCWKFRHDGNSDRSVEDAMRFLEKVINMMYGELIADIANCYDQLQEGETITTGSLAGDEAYLKTLMPQIVPTMPDVEVKYVEVPEELQNSFSPAAYLTPALDDFQHNIILTNPKDQEEYSMSTLAHEGFPGHMYQFTYQYSLGTIPKFLCVIETNGYAESWSTNSEINVARINERFGAEYATVLFLDEMITNSLVMYCSLMVNGQGATKSQVKSYLDGWGLAGATDQIYDLCITMPIYYAKYVMGFTELYELTETCKNTLGDRFDSVSFYREYLSWGPGYFDLLRKRMADWTDAQ